MVKSLEQISLELDEKIPRDVVSERDGGGGRKLSYLEGWYVIDRLNKIFGHLNWSKEIIDIKEVVNTTPRGEFPAYLVKVRLEVRIPKGETKDGYSFYETVVKEGYGYGSDKSGQNAHELAIKEAVTDALKVAAKDLGMSLGLALYDKTQENVDDAINPPQSSSNARPSKVLNKKEAKVSAPKENPAANTAEPASIPVDSRTLLQVVQGYVNIARAQKKSDKTKEYFTNLGVLSPEDLSKLDVEKLNQAKAYLEELTNGK